MENDYTDSSCQDFCHPLAVHVPCSWLLSSLQALLPEQATVLPLGRKGLSHTLPGILLWLVISPTYHHAHVDHTSYTTDSGSPGLLVNLHHQSFTSSGRNRGGCIDGLISPEAPSTSSQSVTWLSWTGKTPYTQEARLPSHQGGPILMASLIETTVSVRSSLIFKFL